MTELAKVWFYFVGSNLLTSKHLSTVRKNEAILLYAILKGYKLSVGKIIKSSILSYFRSNYRGLLPHPSLITRLCILRGVEGDWEEEETCSKTSPLTLTSIAKPKKKGKKKVQEIEEEQRDNRENEQAIVVSSIKEREERQRSLSPIWNLSPNVRDYQQEPT